MAVFLNTSSIQTTLLSPLESLPIDVLYEIIVFADNPQTLLVNKLFLNATATAFARLYQKSEYPKFSQICKGLPSNLSYLELFRQCRLSIRTKLSLPEGNALLKKESKNLSLSLMPKQLEVLLIQEELDRNLVIFYHAFKNSKVMDTPENIRSWFQHNPSHFQQYSHSNPVWVKEDTRRALTLIPPEVVQTGIKALSFLGNKLTKLPAGIGNLTTLTDLYLFHNQLTKLPTGIGNLTNLTALDLSHNQLTELPPGIGNLTNLTALYLEKNQLTELPAEIGNLTNLTGLYLLYNQLTELPAEIGMLTNLTHLTFPNNQLKKLPAEISNLSNLTSLYLSNNQLKKLPAGLDKLKKLTRLDLRGNPIPQKQIALLRKQLPNTEISF